MANPLHDAAIAPLAARATPFLILPDGLTLTGAEVHALAARMAGALRHLGVRPGDRIVVQVEKSPEALALYLGAVVAGAVFVPLNPAYVDAEVAYFLSDAEPALFVCTPRRAGAFAGGNIPVRTLDAGGAGSLADEAAAMPPIAEAEPRGPDDLAAILYTSGTTGRAKGAMLTHRNLLSNAEALADLWRFTDADVLLHALPIFHTHGLFVACHVTLLARAAMIFLPGFDTAEVVRLLPRATVMMGVPTFYTRLLDTPAFTREVASSLRLFISGSAPLRAETHAAFEARTGHRILERYGMTETSMIASNPYDGPRVPGSVGHALPGVEVRTEPVFAGYWRQPEKTAAEMTGDGFFRTGDLGEIDEGGTLTILGRNKDLVISGGMNIHPREVEEALDAVPGVREAAVIGVPHADLGEAAFAVLVLEDGVEVAGVLAALEGRIARFKIPRAGVAVPDLPRNAMGKVQKAELRGAHAGWFVPKPTV